MGSNPCQGGEINLLESGEKSYIIQYFGNLRMHQQKEINYQMRMRGTGSLIVPSAELNFRGKYLVAYLAVS